MTISICERFLMPPNLLRKDVFEINIGDLVTRRSYNNDINFIFIDIADGNAILTGLDYRLIADAPLSDLCFAQVRHVNNDDEFFYESIPKPAGKKYGTVLHIDGDPFYLKICLSRYEKLGVAATGISVKENEQPIIILDLLKNYKPNILVITGHDSMKKNASDSMDINDYKNSKYFVECVEKARAYNPNYDELIIIAGGCQSHYEALMKAGANFASSPDRIFINITDPVYVACKLAHTSFKKIVDIDKIAREFFSGIGGIGGIETRGQCREVKPGLLHKDHKHPKH